MGKFMKALSSVSFIKHLYELLAARRLNAQGLTQPHIVHEILIWQIADMHEAVVDIYFLDHSL